MGPFMGPYCAMMYPELANTDPQWAASVPCCCFMDPDCACTSFLGESAALQIRVALSGMYSTLGFTSRSCNWNTVLHDKRTLPSSFAM